MYHPDSAATLHQRILKDAGLEHLRLHDLRYTFVTLALQNGVDIKTVSAMLGHHDASFTLGTYTRNSAPGKAFPASALLFSPMWVYDLPPPQNENFLYNKASLKRSC